MNEQPESGDFVRVTAACHTTHLGDPVGNAQAAVAALTQYADSDVVVFGELSLTGYTCGDLFGNDALLKSAIDGLQHVVEATNSPAGRLSEQLVIVGVPLRHDDRLFNCAAAIHGGRLLGIVPKQYLPNYQEFYEARWFASADGSETPEVSLENLGTIPFGTDLLIQWGKLVVGVEICEDLWMPVPPSSSQAMAGANLLVNLSASNELIGKAEWRETLVRSQSGRCLAAYAYASAGPTESSTDLVFGGHCLVVEDGQLLAESSRIGGDGCAWIDDASATAEIDLARLAHQRRITTSWQQAAQRCNVKFRRVEISGSPTRSPVARRFAATPFVPTEGPALQERCAEIFGIQCAALARRVRCLPDSAPLIIGVSGGLDSTLALLVAVKTCHQQGWPTSRINGLTMPGFGTTQRTLQAARQLMQHLDVSADEIDICELSLQTYRQLGHRPFGLDVSDMDVPTFVAALESVPTDQLHDLVFENVQARVRTLLLMNRGFVLGTGDLSEQALGWSTYNGDHMSMYNVNTSIPKTLVRFLVQFVAESEFEGPARDCLLGIVDTPISPELLPARNDQIDQKTESTIGPYELHDFFLYHMIRHGSDPNKILQLAKQTDFSQAYSADTIRRTLITFLQRFFENQFKRSCVPDGPKVGSVSLSPRGDWRMPSDAVVETWIRSLGDQ